MRYQLDSPLTPDQVGRLLDELCTVLGFCLPPSSIEGLQKRPPLNASDFADEVFAAEGLDPVRSDRRLWRRVRDLIGTHFQRAGNL